MKAGTLRHRVTFQMRTAEKDEYGGQLDVWADTFPSIPAAFEALKGRELMAAQVISNESQYKVTTRYFPGIEPSRATAMRIVFGTRVMNIIDATNVDERNRELQFICSEGLSKG